MSEWKVPSIIKVQEGMRYPDKWIRTGSSASPLVLMRISTGTAVSTTAEGGPAPSDTAEAIAKNTLLHVSELTVVSGEYGASGLRSIERQPDMKHGEADDRILIP